MFAEFGGINAVDGGGSGPFNFSGGGQNYVDDPNFFAYVKSRIAWFQNQGGTVLAASLWTWPNGTAIGPTMAPTFGSTWP
jgi:hypothetical protein